MRAPQFLLVAVALVVRAVGSHPPSFMSFNSCFNLASPDTWTCSRRGGFFGCLLVFFFSVLLLSLGVSPHTRHNRRGGGARALVAWRSGVGCTTVPFFAPAAGCALAVLRDPLKDTNREQQKQREEREDERPPRRVHKWHVRSCRCTPCVVCCLSGQLFPVLRSRLSPFPFPFDPPPAHPPRHNVSHVVRRCSKTRCRCGSFRCDDQSARRGQRTIEHGRRNGQQG
jgi:hypothetical protein